MSTKKRGTVVWFNNAKGFGFLGQQDGSGDLFVHHTCIDAEGYRSLQGGDLVEYDIEEGPKARPQAVNVRVVKE